MQAPDFSFARQPIVWAGLSVIFSVSYHSAVSAEICVMYTAKEKKKTVLKGDLSTFCMNNLHLSSCVALCFRFHDRLFFWYVHTQMNPAGAVHRWRQSIWVESFKFEILLTHHSWWTGTPCISQPCSSTSPRSRRLCSGEKHTQTCIS